MIKINIYLIYIKINIEREIKRYEKSSYSKPLFAQEYIYIYKVKC